MYTIIICIVYYYLLHLYCYTVVLILFCGILGTIMVVCDFVYMCVSIPPYDKLIPKM